MTTWLRQAQGIAQNCTVVRLGEAIPEAPPFTIRHPKGGQVLPRVGILFLIEKGCLASEARQAEGGLLWSSRRRSLVMWETGTPVIHMSRRRGYLSSRSEPPLPLLDLPSACCGPS